VTLPRWLARVNRRLFNPWVLRHGDWPVLGHVGRRTGRSLSTPIDAHVVADGYLFIANYGSGSDWVQNILAAGSATLDTGGEVVELTRPEIVPVEVGYSLLAPDDKRPPSFVGAESCLRMRTAQL
jgi:deazaflavin-dependent oxidoreductase (nitroreductase family)